MANVSLKVEGTRQNYRQLACALTPKGLFTAHELNWTELIGNKATQLHDAFIGYARQRHDHTSFWLAAATLERLSARLVLNTVVHTGIRDLEFSSVQFLCCGQALTLTYTVMTFACYIGYAESSTVRHRSAFATRCDFLPLHRGDDITDWRDSN